MTKISHETPGQHSERHIDKSRAAEVDDFGKDRENMKNAYRKQSHFPDMIVDSLSSRYVLSMMSS